jgi:hypothetical protein
VRKEWPIQPGDTVITQVRQVQLAGKLFNKVAQKSGLTLTTELDRVEDLAVKEEWQIYEKW